MEFPAKTALLDN